MEQDINWAQRDTMQMILQYEIAIRTHITRPLVVTRRWCRTGDVRAKASIVAPRNVVTWRFELRRIDGVENGR